MLLIKLNIVQFFVRTYLGMVVLRKAVPNAFSNGIMGVVVHPVMVTLN